ncbi:NAD(P)H-hydrate dehydratase [Paucibacter sp. B2R-40]|uniref:NAD(P)H-hydrate dehydratase n=1 Tax=Paucibacter sp. B2R-40 TaxID=2893554 RepID=UPI0021E3DCE4|nr:NAD(P)H-hydrate dehydratase [Paucibacter sp. B2R-40]MCV2355141.1 NAD(P)H-hydrate dehydratase [Paucibacter sp. B2R-40]
MPIKLLPTANSWPLFDAASSRVIEAAALAHVGPNVSLMERAGLAAARLTLALVPAGTGPIWIACGPGNNGGDGLVAARLLHQQGLKVQVSLIAASQSPPADAATALAKAQQAGVPISDVVQAPAGVRLGLDALLGLGLNRSRPPSPEMAAAFTALNSLGAPVLAMDLPSGLLPDTGALAGELAVRADHTLTLLTLKPGLFTAQGRAHSGQIWFDELDQTPVGTPDALLIGAECLARWRLQNTADPTKHKGTQGDVLVIGGAAGMRGAARLAARAALAAGGGRVYACLLGAPADEADPQRPELMRFDQARIQASSAIGDWRHKVLVCGCGGGSEIAKFLPPLLQHAQRLVLDADGLNAVAADKDLQVLLKQRQSLGLATILTPHPLEAARLLGSDATTVQSDRLKAAQLLADEFLCAVILKGSGSIIAGPQRRPAINSSGNAALATAGSGDVLAGWLGGLWAQQSKADPFSLASLGCYWHGEAAESQTAGPLRAADLVERMYALHRAP